MNTKYFYRARYTSESLQAGDAGLNFAHVSEDDISEWVCTIGPRHQFCIEVTDSVLVRETGPFAAKQITSGCYYCKESYITLPNCAWLLQISDTTIRRYY